MMTVKAIHWRKFELHIRSIYSELSKLFPIPPDTPPDSHISYGPLLCVSGSKEKIFGKIWVSTELMIASLRNREVCGFTNRVPIT